MSIERELLKRFMTELKTEEDVISLFNDIKECLAQPEQTEQEPVAWITEWVQRYRHNDTPIMDRAVSFTKGDAPAVPNPNYIPLYTALPTHLISAAPELLEALSNWINALDDPSEWMKCRDDAKKAIEKAHGITGVDYE